MKDNANSLSQHVLPNSATMVGVCITVISIVKSMNPDMINNLIDKFLAVDSIVFMISAVVSFWSIRSERSTQSLERVAEILFLIGLLLMTVITVIFSFEII